MGTAEQPGAAGRSWSSPEQMKMLFQAAGVCSATKGKKKQGVIMARESATSPAGLFCHVHRWSLPPSCPPHSPSVAPDPVAPPRNGQWGGVCAKGGEEGPQN